MLETWTVKIDRQTGAGWQDISAYLDVNKFHIPVQRSRSIYQGNSQLYTTNSCHFSIIPSNNYAAYAALVQQILTAPNEVLIWIQRSGVDSFTGILRPTDKTTIGSTKITRMDVECVDSLYFLSVRQTLAPVGYFGYKVSDPTDKTHSILHQLFYLAGYLDASLNLPSITTVLAAFSAKQNVYFGDIIKELLFEYGFVVYADSSGVIQGYDLGPSSVVPSKTLQTGVNIQSPYTATRKETTYDAIDITWNEIDTLEQTVIFQDNTGSAGGLSCSIPVAAGLFYPKNASDSQDAYCDYSIQDYTIIACMNIQALQLEYTGDIENLDSWAPGPLRAPLRLTSSGGGVITELQIVGDAIVQGDQFITSFENVANTAKRQALTAQYIFDSATANRLMSIRASYFANAQFTYDIQCSDFSINPGDYVTLDENIAGVSQTCRVLQVQDGDSPEYIKLSLEGFEPITLQTPSGSQLTRYTPPVIPQEQVSGAVNTAIENSNFPTVQEIVQTGLQLSSFATNVPLIPGTGSPSGNYDGVPIIVVGVFKGIMLMWGQQRNPNLTNLLYYEVQVSPNGSDWYTLRFDGVDYKDSVDPSTTKVGVEYLLHTLPDNLDGGGNPQPYTLQYRVRRRVTAGTFTDWSDVVSGTSKCIGANDITADSISANKLTAGALQAAFAQISTELVIGATYAIGGSPNEGDQQLVVLNNTIALQEYDSGSWNTITQIGGTGSLKWFLQARGLIKPGANVDSLPVGNIAPSGAKIFGFESTYADQSSTDPWDTKLGTYSCDAMQHRFGGHALTGNIGSLQDSDANGATFGAPFSLDEWILPSVLPASGPPWPHLIDLGTAPSSTCDVDTSSATAIETTDIYPSKALQISSDSLLLAKVRNSDSHAIVQKFTVSNKTLTPGDSLDVGAVFAPIAGNDSRSVPGIRMCLLSADEVVLAYFTKDASTTYTLHVRRLVISTLTLGPDSVAGTMANALDAMTVFDICMLNAASRKFLVAYVSETSHTTTLCARAATVDSSDNYTWGTVVAVTQVGSVMLAQLDTDKAVVYQEGNLCIITASGTTLTFGSWSAFGGGVSIVGGLAVLSATKFAITYWLYTGYSYVLICTVASSTITQGTPVALPYAAQISDLAALSASLIAISYLNASSYPAVLMATVAGTVPSLGAAVQLAAEASTKIVPQIVVNNSEMRCVIFWEKNAASPYDLKGIVAFMHQTWIRLSMISTGFRFSYFNSVGGVGQIDIDFAATAGSWHHLSINNDQANKAIYFTVDQVEQSHSYSSETLVTTACTLLLSLPATANQVWIDDLLYLPTAYMSWSAYSEMHATSGQPWVDSVSGIDLLNDLILMATSSGKVRIIGASNVAPLPNSTAGVGQDDVLISAISAALSLPAGGIWQWRLLLINSSGVFQAQSYNVPDFRGISAGGTQIWAGQATYRGFAWIWRIG